MEKQLKRRVIIIQGYAENSMQLSYFNDFAKYYYDFFTSDAGGAYEPEEITYLEEYTFAELQVFKQLFVKPDFVVIVFIGHGATQEDYQLFQLKEKEIIKAGQFTLEVDKELIIIESCRTIGKNYHTLNLTNETPMFQQGGVFQLPQIRQTAKKLYFKQVAECNNGRVICFACSKGEKAYAFYFSKYLINCAWEWHLQNKGKTLSIVSLMNSLIAELPKIVKDKRKEEQNPQILGDIDFPFAIGTLL
jgi:hypothetical protein